MKIIQDRRPVSAIDPASVLVAAEIAAIDECIAHYPQPRAAVLDALKIVQHRTGWVNDDKAAAVAALLGISVVDVEEVATFFNRIYRKPVGRHVILLCDSIACYLTGYEEVIAKMKGYLGIDYGQTTVDNRFTLLPICCLGKCDEAPAVLIDEDTYGNLSADNVIEILEGYS